MNANSNDSGMIRDMWWRLNDNSEFYIGDQWENNGFDSNVTNEGTKENQVQEGNENVNIVGMMNWGGVL
jgi:hypothetical protein